MPRGFWVWLSREEARQLGTLLRYHLDGAEAVERVDPRYKAIVRRLLARVGRAEKKAERRRRGS